MLLMVVLWLWIVGCVMLCNVWCSRGCVLNVLLWCLRLLCCISVLNCMMFGVMVMLFRLGSVLMLIRCVGVVSCMDSSGSRFCLLVSILVLLLSLVSSVSVLLSLVGWW